MNTETVQIRGHLAPSARALLRRSCWLVDFRSKNQSDVRNKEAHQVPCCDRSRVNTKIKLTQNLSGLVWTLWSVPKSERSKTGPAPCERSLRGGVVDVAETKMMRVRWKSFQFFTQISEEVSKKLFLHVSVVLRSLFCTKWLFTSSLIIYAKRCVQELRTVHHSVTLFIAIYVSYLKYILYLR